VTGTLELLSADCFCCEKFCAWILAYDGSPLRTRPSAYFACMWSHPVETAYSCRGNWRLAKSLCKCLVVSASQFECAERGARLCFQAWMRASANPYPQTEAPSGRQPPMAEVARVDALTSQVGSLPARVAAASLCPGLRARSRVDEAKKYVKRQLVRGCTQHRLPFSLMCCRAGHLQVCRVHVSWIPSVLPGRCSGALQKAVRGVAPPTLKTTQSMCHRLRSRPRSSSRLSA
jgi:hypothetical protein